MSEVLTIVGGARNVWEDVKAAPLDIVMCINDIGMHFPHKFHYWYSHDASMLPRWKDAIRPEYKDINGSVETHTIDNSVEGVDKYWKLELTTEAQNMLAMSSLFGAIYIGLEMGFRKIILCGCPLDDTGHYYDPPGTKTKFEEWCLEYLRTIGKEDFGGRVKSMSGNTAKILGQA